MNKSLKPENYIYTYDSICGICSSIKCKDRIKYERQNIRVIGCRYFRKIGER